MDPIAIVVDRDQVAAVIKLVTDELRGLRGRSEYIAERLLDDDLGAGMASAAKEERSEVIARIVALEGFLAASNIGVRAANEAKQAWARA